MQSTLWNLVCFKAEMKANSFISLVQLFIGLCGLCRHNFEHNASSIMPGGGGGGGGGGGCPI